MLLMTFHLGPSPPLPRAADQQSLMSAAINRGFGGGQLITAALAGLVCAVACAQATVGAVASVNAAAASTILVSKREVGREGSRDFILGFPCVLGVPAAGQQPGLPSVDVNELGGGQLTAMAAFAAAGCVCE